MATLQKGIDASRTNYLWLPAVLAAGAIFLGACDETMRASYATAAEARADGAVLRGWLPDEMPDSAAAISEAHDLDTNTGEGSFQFDAADADSFRAKLKPASAALVQRRFRHSEQLRRDGYNFYAVPKFALAINWQTRHVRFVLDGDSE